MRDDTDNELEAYLKGEEPLSSLYRGLDGEEPPAALDAAILAAARENLPGKGSGAGRRAAYAIAASLMLSTVAVLMFSTLDRPPSPAAARLAPEPLAVNPSPERQESAAGQAPAPALPEAPSLALPQTLPPVLREAPPPALPAPIARSPSPASPAASELSRNAIDEARESIASAAREAANERLASAREPEDAAGGARTEAVASLNEITVTGSRIRRDFRDSPESWLEEIRSLLDQGRREAADEELRLLRERYPAFDYQSVLDYPE